MEKLTEVLAMGGYGSYVWPSFAVAAFILITMAVTTIHSLRKTQDTLAEFQKNTVNDET